VPRAADGLHVHAVVGAAGEASHQAVRAHGVALGVAPRRGQGRHVGACAEAGAPRHVGHGLGHLHHAQVGGTAGTWRGGAGGHNAETGGYGGS
jgi:hypothetical protein